MLNDARMKVAASFIIVFIHYSNRGPTQEYKSKDGNIGKNIRVAKENIELLLIIITQLHF